MRRQTRSIPETGAIILLLAGVLTGMAGDAAAQSSQERIEFGGFFAGETIHDQYAFRGVRLPLDPNGGPYYDDADAFAFLLDSPPGLLSLNPLSVMGGGGAVHGSVGTYVFDFVDPQNPFVPSFTDHVLVAVAFPDRGETVLTGWDASGVEIVRASMNLGSSSFFPIYLSVSAAGIRKATVTTPLWNGTIGALIDTLTYSRPVEIPAQLIDIDIRPGSPRNTIRLGGTNTVSVAVLSGPSFRPDQIDPGKVLFQRASPTTALLVDRNHDRKRDLILTFRIADLVGLAPGSTEGVLTAVDSDGTPLMGVDAVIVQAGPTAPIFAFPSASTPGGGSRLENDAR